MTEINEPHERDVGTAIALLVIGLMGLIPWIPVLFGEKPAYSAELGALVTFFAALLFGVELWDLRPRARARSPRHSREEA